MVPDNPGDEPEFVPDEVPSLEKTHKKYETGLQHIQAQLKRTDVNLQEAKAKLMQVLARPENIGLEVTDFTYKFIDNAETYELTLLLIKDFLEGYLTALEESTDVAEIRLSNSKASMRQIREIDRLRKQNMDLFDQYRFQQDALQKALMMVPQEDGSQLDPTASQDSQIEPEKQP